MSIQPILNRGKGGAIATRQIHATGRKKPSWLKLTKLRLLAFSPHDVDLNGSEPIAHAQCRRLATSSFLGHPRNTMSRAFVNEDSGQWGNPARRFNLPERDDPEFDKAAAEAMLEAARDGDTGSAEMATGYYWGEPKLKPFVAEILKRVESENDERMIQLAERFLK